MHMICTYWHLFQKASSQLFSFFWQQYRSCHSVANEEVTMTIRNNTRQITTKYSLEKELTKTKQEKTRQKKTEKWYSMKTSPLLPTVEKKSLWQFKRYVELFTVIQNTYSFHHFYWSLSSETLPSFNSLKVSIVSSQCNYVLRINSYNKHQLLTHTTFTGNIMLYVCCTN